MATVIVQVTHEDIMVGVPCDPYFCPVAHAIERVVPGRAVYVSGTQVVIDDSTVNVSLLPEEVTERIQALDGGEGMEPFEFDLEVAA